MVDPTAGSHFISRPAGVPRGAQLDTRTSSPRPLSSIRNGGKGAAGREGRERGCIGKITRSNVETVCGSAFESYQTRVRVGRIP